MSKVRTTIMIEERVLKDAKRAAVDRDVSLSRLIEDSIRKEVEFGGTAEALKVLESHFAWADARALRSQDGPLTRQQAHER